MKSKKIIKLENKITKLLDSAKVKYNVLEHKVVYTAHDVGATTKKKLSEIAKVVLVRADKEWALIVVPAGKYIDLAGIKKALKAKKVSIANEKDILKHLKTKIGLLHPFGQVYPAPIASLRYGASKIPTLIDKSMAKAKKMVASAGSFTHSVELAMKDFEKLTQPIKGMFSKAKK
ncbi:MAG: YbaK/EbsC family protein [Patescibacteria group bacterium]